MWGCSSFIFPQHFFKDGQNWIVQFLAGAAEDTLSARLRSIARSGLLFSTPTTCLPHSTFEMSSSADTYLSSGTENDDPYDLTYNGEAQELLNDAIASNNRNRRLNQRLRSSSASKKAGSKRKSTLLTDECM